MPGVDQRSSALRAGAILLLVGSILQAVGAFVLTVLAPVLLTLVREVAQRRGAAVPPSFLPWLLAGFGVVAAVGCVFGFLAYGRARRGDAGGAFAFGLTAALLPPLHIVLLVGAILCKVSPEGESAPVPPSAPAQPPPGWQRP